MRRSFLVLALLGLVASACGSPGGGTGTVAEPPPGGLTGQTAVLRLGGSAPVDAAYAMAVDMAMGMSVEGDFGDAGAAVPGDIEMTMAMDATMDLTIDHLDDGGRRIGWVVALDRIDGEVAMGNERFDIGDLMALEGGAPDDFLTVPMTSTVVVDPQGRVVDASMSVGDENLDMKRLEDVMTLFGGESGTLAGFLGPERQIGVPVLPDGPIGVGSTWTHEETISLLGSDYRTVATYTVAGMAGDVIEIDTVIESDVWTMTQDDFIAAIRDMSTQEQSDLFGAPMPIGEIETAFSMMQFAMTLEPGVVTGRIVFDSGLGIARESTLAQDLTMVIEVSVDDPNFPGGSMLMRMHQSSTTALVLLGG